ncbi:polyketide beta-ketoacyl:ACP synthase [Pseudoalteromonas sp. J010]|uniref:beta-ketoacyl synthase N-terminal-like domain-containing protein n=1 Tax=Pseudoalteromonas sp. J010 TaxID=998465 RepID=UPI000F64F837|nr:beta-ketoacyl synthase N-terminal-like domain-containing protein [Pseudoalteromonas sp. J010]RRS10438.1 polyketide beta-ketoacyl:ACP synthase [Pseudoalteromonas sp. J010]
MKNCSQESLIITGVGITTAVGQGKQAVSDALIAGKHNFAVMKRAGRQYPSSTKQTSQFIGAEIDALSIPEHVSKFSLRNISYSAQAVLATLSEAWHDAQLDKVDPHRIGIIVGGSNIQQREHVLMQDTYRDKVPFVRPTYAMSYMDSDICGLCTEVFPIKGLAYSLGGASASGQLAVIQALEAVKSGQLDVCIAVGALMDLSYWECQAFRSLGAMGSDMFADQPELALRPFDQQHNGFLFGESCAVVVIEKDKVHRDRHITPYGRVAGWSHAVDGNRNPNPSYEGEVKVIQEALKRADLSARDIDYVNPHGTGSIVGDETELRALSHCQLEHAHINTTKSLLGHGLSAAGTTELVATLLQMSAAKLHPSRNLDEPISESFNWVRAQSVSHQIKNALKMSMGFGGLNTAVCLQAYN